MTEKPAGCRLLPFYPANRPTYYELTAEGLRYVAAALGVDCGLCPGDDRPCYVSAGTDDAHHRCGTVQCGQPFNRRKAP